MINSKQRSYLRGLANAIDPIFQIGKGGINDNMVKQIEDALEARELIKIHILNNADASPREFCDELTRRTGAEGVQVIGSKIVLYRPSKENPQITLP